MDIEQLNNNIDKLECTNVNENENLLLVMEEINNNNELNKNVKIKYDVNNNYNNRLSFKLTDNIIKEKLNLLKNNINYFNDLNSKKYKDQELKGISTILNKLYNNVENCNKNLYELPKKNKDKFNFGRLYTKNSLMSLGSYFRSLIVSENQKDLDICNAHPAILLQIIDNLEVPNLKYYIENRDKCLIELQNRFNIDRKEAKKQVLVLINNGKIMKKYHSISWIKGIINEMENIYEYMSKKEIGKHAIKHLYNQCHLINKKYYKPNDTELNLNGSFLNLILIKVEYDIINEVMNYLNNNNIEIYTYCFDGLMISNNYENEDLLKDVSAHIKNTLNLNIEFDFKEVKNKMTDEMIKDLEILNNKKIYNNQHIKTLNKIDDRCKNSFNICSQVAGYSKTTNILKYILNDNNNTNNINVIISPYIINQQSNINKFLELNNELMNKYDIHFIDEIENNEIYDENRINIIVQGDSHRTINNMIESYENKIYKLIAEFDEVEGTNNRSKFNFNNTDYFNKNRTLIFTTYDSFKWPCNYIKTFNKTINNVFLDESIQIFERSINPIKIDFHEKQINHINVQDMIFKIIDLSNTVFISDIMNLNSFYNLTNRKINNIIFDKPKKYVSYDKIYLGNNLQVFIDLILSNVSMFIWSCSKKQCKQIKYMLINVFNIDPSEIVIITADLEYNESFFKYKYIISSPKIRSCISILDHDTDYKDRITCGFHLSNHINEYTFINSLQRVRNTKSLYIFTNILKENKSIYDFNNYNTDTEIKIMSLLNECNNITMKTMINSLIKNENFEMIEDFIQDRKIIFDKCKILKDKSRLLNEKSDIIKKRIIFNNQLIPDDYIDNNDLILIKNDDKILMKVVDLYNNTNNNKKIQYEFINKFRYNKDIQESTNEYKNMILENFEAEYEYLTNHYKIDINYQKVYDLHIIQIEDEFNKSMNNIKSILDKNNIYYKNYNYIDDKNYGVLTDNKLVKTNIKQYYKCKQIINNIESHYNSLDEINKFNFLIKSGNKINKNINPKNHPYINMYKIDKNDIDLTNKLINSFIIEKKDKSKLFFNYFDIDEYGNKLNDDDKLKKMIFNRKDKINISRDITAELLKRDVNINCLNYIKIKNDSGRYILKKVDINEYKFYINDFKFDE